MDVASAKYVAGSRAERHKKEKGKFVLKCTNH